MIRVLIVDDHPIVREGWKRILEDQFDIQVTGEAENASQALELFNANTYEAVLLDLHLPGRNGLEVLKKIHSINPKQAVLIVSISNHKQYLKRVLTGGGRGFLSKDEAADELVTAIRKVASGGRYCNAEQRNLLAEIISGETCKKSHDPLTDREFEILLNIGRGLTVSEIAKILNISVQTVSTHRARILHKMFMDNTAQLIRYVIKEDLLPDD